MKKLITLLTIIGLLICSVPSFSAATVYRYGDWTLIQLSGSEDVAFGVRSYDGSDTAVTVPKDYGGYPITAIDAYAFAGNRTIQEITLGDNINTIGEGAFMSCASLEKLEIPDSVTQIGESAFTGCDELVIYAKSDSAAIKYAIDHEIDYVCTNAITYMLGDADGDGVITILDATAIQRHLTMLSVNDPAVTERNGDVDCNGLDITDATKIQRFLAQFATDAAVGSTVTIYEQ